VHPGKLAEGLRRAAADAGVQIHEHSRAQGISADGDGVRVVSDAGAMRASRASLATSAYPSLLGAIGRYIAPVYDYVLMTEPLSEGQVAAIGWRNRQGLDEGGNQFHYYRLSADRPILFGGYDAVYRYGGPVRPQLDDHQATFAKLWQHFFTVFPQLEGLRFSHRWGGAIDTCSRFFRVLRAGAERPGRLRARLHRPWRQRQPLRCSRRPGPARRSRDRGDAAALRTPAAAHLPPEPLQSVVIQLTRNRLAAAERREGRRGLWLGALDRLGLGFDS
jgi:hypothetical protein